MTTVTNVLAIFSSDKNGRCDRLKAEAEKESAVFTVSSPKTGRNVFHKIVDKHAVNRLNAVREGLSKLTEENSSVRIAINAKDNDSKTPLYLAAAADSYEIAEKLLQMGADPTVKCSREAITAEERAAKAGYVAYTQTYYLLRDARHSDMLECLKDGEFGKTYTHLDKKTNITERDSKGNSPMLLAIQSNKNEEEILSMLENLLKLKDDVDHPNGKDETVLQIAVKRNFNKIVNFLLFEAKANASLTTKLGDTILHIAAQSGAKETTVKSLLKSDARLLINTPNNSGQVPLHFVQSAPILRLFCLNGAKTHIKKEDSWLSVEDNFGRKLADYYLYNPERAKMMEVLVQFDPTKKLEEKMNVVTPPASIVTDISLELGGVMKTVVTEGVKTLGVAAGTAAGAATESFISNMNNSKNE